MTAVMERDLGRGARMAPHSIEAEESVLGAMLIATEAVDVALEKLQPEDFYKPAHQSIFAAVTTLYDAGEPIDALTVTEGLRRMGGLDQVGGIAYVSGLSDAVPTSANVAHYVAIVEEHALRRRLMRAGGEIGTVATAVDQPIEDVLDIAEQTVYAVSDRRIGDGWPRSALCCSRPSSRPRSCTERARRSPARQPATPTSTARWPVSTTRTW